MNPASTPARRARITLTARTRRILRAHGVPDAACELSINTFGFGTPKLRAGTHAPAAADALALALRGIGWSTTTGDCATVIGVHYRA